MNPLTVNPVIVLQHSRQARDAERRLVRRDERAVRAARAAREALQRASG